MEIPESKIQFVVGLSNGESLVEGKGILAKVSGELSPWLKLQAYLKERDLKITSLNLWVGDRHYNLPSVNPKFGGLIPESFNCFRKMSSNIGIDPRIEHYICAEAIYKDFTVQLWIDEQECLKTWVNIISQEEKDQKERMSMEV